MLLLRRFVVFQAFLLWQGGFLFYSGIVVPIGTEVLGSPLIQGLITRRVTIWLNLIGLVWAVVFAWDLAAGRDPNRRRRLTRWLGWGVCVALLAALYWLHGELDARLDLEAESILNRREFRTFHILYLWGSTVHWVLGLVLAWLTLSTWRAADGLQVASRKSETGDP